MSKSDQRRFEEACAYLAGLEEWKEVEKFVDQLKKTAFITIMQIAKTPEEKDEAERAKGAYSALDNFLNAIAYSAEQGRKKQDDDFDPDA